MLGAKVQLKIGVPDILRALLTLNLFSCSEMADWMISGESATRTVGGSLRNLLESLPVFNIFLTSSLTGNPD
jgi:hypothetical protein